MKSEIERITAENYPLFDDMVYWRQNGIEREPAGADVSERIRRELSNSDLFIYAIKADGRYVGWISLVYIPKVGKWNGKGHIYVDELWVAPDYRGQGLGKELMKKAEELMTDLGASGIRLYVSEDNPAAKRLYESCGYQEAGNKIFFEIM